MIIMKKNSLLFLILFISLNGFTQVTLPKLELSNNYIKSQTEPAFLKLLPANLDPSKLRPADIPSENILRKMGFTEPQIKEAMDFKFQKGKYSIISSDTASLQRNLSKFYENLGDSLNTDTFKYPMAKIYGQDIFRNNKLSFFDKALDAKAPENYKVGSGDEISISIWGYSEFSENMLVDERGYIHPSSLGRIYVKGLTFKKMRSILKNKFSTYLDMKNSEIDVTLAYSRVITVNIVGEVYHPGSYTIPAINTAFNALISAKGPNQLGSVRSIYIKRDGIVVDSLDVYHFLFNPLRSRDIYLQDGDYIVVPPAGNIVEVIGQVNRPYTYEAKYEDNIHDILRYAGGFTTTAFRDILTLKRVEYNNTKVIDVVSSSFNTTSLLNGDHLIVNSISNKLSNVVSLNGSIGVAGEYEFIKGERFLDFLQRTKSIDDKTFMEKAYIIRLNEDRTKSHISIDLDAVMNDKNHKDNLLLEEYDAITVLSIDDFDDNFFVTIYGEVRKPNKYSFGDGMTLQDILLKAGGLNQLAEGSKVEISRIMDYNISSNKLKPIRGIVKSINIGNNLLLSSSANDFVLKPYDQVFVRKNPDFIEPKNVYIGGEVKYPGIYSIVKKNEKLSSFIRRAGGVTPFADLDGAQMFRRFTNEIKLDRFEDIEVSISADLEELIIDNPELSSIYLQEVMSKKMEQTRLNDESIKTLSQEYSYDLVYSNFNKALKSPKSQYNLILQEGDSIIIPRTLNLVKISGDLSNFNGNSISAPYLSRKRANYYVNNYAGGFSKENSKKKTLVIYPNGVTKKSTNFGLFSISPKIKRGSTIKVVDKHKTNKKRNEIDWNRQIENAMLKVSAILTLWLLVERVSNEQ